MRREVRSLWGGVRGLGAGRGGQRTVDKYSEAVVKGECSGEYVN